jgi:hypothetical protein
VDAVSRRLELLKLEGLGFSQAEIVKELSVKCACSRRTVYNDFESREDWCVGCNVVTSGDISRKSPFF